MRLTDKAYSSLSNFVCTYLLGSTLTDPLSDQWEQRLSTLEKGRYGVAVALLLVAIVLLPYLVPAVPKVGLVVALFAFGGYVVGPIASVYSAKHDNEKLKNGERVSTLGIQQYFSSTPVVLGFISVMYATLELVTNSTLIGISIAFSVFALVVGGYISIVSYEKAKNTKFDGLDESELYVGELFDMKNEPKRIFPSHNAYEQYVEEVSSEAKQS